MPSQIKEVELEVDDRVAVIEEGQIVKVRVAAILPMGRVKVTRNANDPGTVFVREQIYPLYRYIDIETPVGKVKAIAPLCAA